MRILWLTWKDLSHPQAGGAELLNEKMAERLVQRGHEVTLLVGSFKDAKPSETRNGYKIIRLGTRYTVYREAARYVKKHLKDWPDVVIEEINTVPFFSNRYMKKPITYLFYQTCREIWFYQMLFPLNLIGYLIEPIYLRYLAAQKNLVLVESESARQDLAHFGFNPKRTSVFSVGVETKPLPKLDIKKYDSPTMLSLGSIRNMKRPDHQIKAFEYAKEQIPDLQLLIAGTGDGPYFESVMQLIHSSRYKKDIHYLGRVSLEKKHELMQRSHVITVTSVKEGWGLIVTEANSQGTPAVVYNADGLRDSVQDMKTGLIAKKNTPQGLADQVVALLKDQTKYDKIQTSAWEWSKELTFDRGTDKVEEVLKQSLQL